MSQAHSENGSFPDIVGELETFDQLSEQHRRYASLGDNVERERQSVKRHIYEKVKAEYEARMRSVEEDLKRQRELLEEKIRDVLDRRSDLEELCRKDTERLEEIDFRTRVGEFTEEECRQERGEIDERTKRQTKELARLEEIVGRCTRSGLLADDAPGSGPGKGPAEVEDAPKEEEDPPAEASEECHAEESREPRPEAREAASAEAEEDFEILEEDSIREGHETPVVHCPPSVSSGSPQPVKRSGTDKARGSPHVDISEYVTGYLVALEGSRKGERFPMISSNITLGSSPGIDIRLLDPGIANFHARILYKERKHFLENLDSKGRSYVNGVQAATVVELKDGDVVRLGDIKMQVEYASAQTPAVN